MYGVAYGVGSKRCSVAVRTEDGHYIITQLIANVFVWFLVAPVLDILIYSEAVALSFTQGLVAGASNIVSAGVIGSLLLFLYSKTRAKKGRLTKE